MSFLNIKEDLINYAYDPNKVQVELYKHMENLLEGNDIPDPTNPFMFLMESNATIGSVLLEQMKTNLRKLYPVLAQSKDDLYHHIYSREIENIFAYPSIGTFTISIPVAHMTTYGENKGKYYELTIPRFTKITVKNFYSFLFLNEVVIRYYPINKKTMVLLMPSELSIGFMGNEVITSYIVTDNNNLDWILLNVTLKQVDAIYTKEPVIPSEGYNRDIELNDQFYTLYSRATSPSLGELDLIPTFSDFVYDVKKPILKCKLKNNKLINLLMYDAFINNSDFNTIETLIFTTKGNLTTSFGNLDKKDFIVDFTLVNDIGEDLNRINNVTMIVFSNAYVNGGRNMLSLTELKDIIINNTTGDNKLPITNYDLKERINRLGYTISENLDSTLRREYTVSKDLSFSKDNYIYANPDIYLDTLVIDKNKIVSLPDKVSTNNGRIIIEPFTFLEKDEHSFKLVPQALVNKFKSATLEEASELLKNGKYFYTIFKYICDYKDSLDYRVYDTNTPKVNYIKSIYYNKDMDFNLIYVDKYVKRIDNTYNLILKLDIDDVAAEMINNETIKALIRFKPSDTGSDIVIEGEFDTVANTLTFSFVTDSYIDNDDKTELKVISGILDIVKIKGKLDSKIYIYSTDTNLNQTNDNYINDILEFDTLAISTISVFDLHIKFYEKIEYLFSNYRVTPTLRKYKKYDKDIYLTYLEDVYEKDKDDNYVFEETEFNGKKIKELKVKHKKGDFVLNSNGEKIIKYKKGDVVLDRFNRPIIDYDNGFIHFVDILVFELEFLLTKDENYRKYIIEKYLELNNYLLEELKQLNNELLENTKLVYRPKNKLTDVKINKNNTIYNTPSMIEPTLIVYIIENITDANEFNEIIRKINIYFQEALGKFNNKNKISEYIISKLNYENIQFIKINNMDVIGDLTVYNYLPDSNKFTFVKKLEVNKSGNYVPQLSFNLELIKI